MPYQSKDLSVLAYANGFTLWHFTTADAAAAVDTAGYFNAAADMLRAGDIIIANVESGGTPGALQLFVTSASSGVVTVSVMSHS